VDVSAVRDLFGTVHSEGAIKGILVTTSYFGDDSYEFIRNKPLTLISGLELLGLLEKHGYKFRIDLEEAKRLVAQKQVN
jgi:restriction system protein